jgi:cobyrinic acid a,c-diamide synthase
MIAAPLSGGGKTTVTLGLLAAFRARGIRVGAAKSGPDYIDPALHAAASGRPSLNLDTWAMPPAMLDALAVQAAEDVDLLLVESAMGLFDGALVTDGGSGAASELASRFGWPVLLVLDVSGQAQTAAAVAHGMDSYDPSVRVAGLILNRVASPRHENAIRKALQRVGAPVVGVLPRQATIALPERHLGLVQAREQSDLMARLEALRAFCEAYIDLDDVMQLASPFRLATAMGAQPLPPPAQRIAMARDDAFSFIYPHVVDGWRRAGAEVVYFSPMADEPPPDDCGACWLPGGYPELHAGVLAGAARFKAGLAAFAETRPVHGECGGYMVLGEVLIDAAGQAHAMAGLLSHATSFAKRKLHLGYREARLLSDGLLGAAGDRVRGHEHHHSSLVEPGRDAPLVQLSDSTGTDLGMAGGRRGWVSGSYFHVVAKGSQVSPSAVNGAV